MTVPRPPRPVPGPPRDYHFPRFQTQALANGVKVVTAPIHRLPIATVLAVVDAGAVCDPPGREGVAQLAAKLLLEGAGSRDGAELAEQFERLGATIEAAADWDAGVISMTVTSANLPRAFSLFADVLRRPAFRPREIERIKSERLVELLQLRAEPRGLADEFLGAALYHPSSRYAIAEGGTESTVNAITAEDIGAIYASRFAPDTTTLVVTGDVAPAAALALAREHLGDWSGRALPATPSVDKPARATRATHLVAKVDAPQSELRMGHVAVPRTHPDYFDLVVMNAILGGLFNSRVNMNLREAHAYTYGAFSAFDWRRGAGPFVVSTAVRSDVTAESIREVLIEIERMRTEPVPDAELTLATSYLDGVFPIRYETTAAVAAALANQVIYGLPDDYFDRYRDRIRAVTATSVLEAAQSHLAPDRMQAVVVGDAAAVRGSLETVGFGPLILHTTDGSRP
jgi:zinc protease